MKKKLTGTKLKNILLYGGMPKQESIDMIATGRRIKRLIKSSGYTIKEIQNYLNLSCPQPINRWCNGTVLPSIDHLYSLSRLLHVHMEDFIVPTNRASMKDRQKRSSLFRMYSYMRMMPRR